MSHVVTEITSHLARSVMREDAPRGPVIDHLARAAYEGHGIGLYGRSWDELGDAQKERWRWTVCAVLLEARNGADAR